MDLQLGGFETISGVSEVDIARYLRLMDIKNSFVILTNQKSEFVQAAYLGDKYQIEYSLTHGAEQFQAFGDYELTKQLFLTFLRESVEYQTMVKWKRISIPD